MTIRRTRPDELDDVMAIYAQARVFMAANGNPHQWGASAPRREKIIASINAGDHFSCLDGQGRRLAVFTLRAGPDPTYSDIDGRWLDRRPYGVVHSIASARLTAGAAAFCLNWAWDRFGNIRIDTHQDNIPMQRLLAKLGYQRCGVIITDNGTPRLAYQKN